MEITLSHNVRTETFPINARYETYFQSFQFLAEHSVAALLSNHSIRLNPAAHTQY